MTVYRENAGLCCEVCGKVATRRTGKRGACTKHMEVLRQALVEQVKAGNLPKSGHIALKATL